jgi:hypothetical protein
MCCRLLYSRCRAAVTASIVFGGCITGGISRGCSDVLNHKPEDVIHPQHRWVWTLIINHALIPILGEDVVPNPP